LERLAGRKPPKPRHEHLDHEAACGVRKVGSACKSAIFSHAIEFTHPKSVQ